MSESKPQVSPNRSGFHRKTFRVICQCLFIVDPLIWFFVYSSFTQIIIFGYLFLIFLENITHTMKKSTQLTRTHARTHARTQRSSMLYIPKCNVHARTHACMHVRTHARTHKHRDSRRERERKTEVILINLTLQMIHQCLLFLNAMWFQVFDMDSCNIRIFYPIADFMWFFNLTYISSFKNLMNINCMNDKK